MPIIDVDPADNQAESLRRLMQYYHYPMPGETYFLYLKRMEPARR